jgi:hypothetical protein
LPEKIGGMIGHHDGGLDRPLVAQDATAQSGKRGARTQEILGGHPSEREKKRRANEGNLPLEIRKAGATLVVERGAVVGRPTLHDVGNEDPLPCESESLEHLVEKTPRAADEGFATEVLVVTRALAHEKPAGVAIAHPEHGPRPAGREGAAGAGRDFFFEGDPAR